MNARNHSRSLVVRCPSLMCTGISGTPPKYNPCSLCQSLYALQSDTMVSVIAARLPTALSRGEEVLKMARANMADLGTCLRHLLCQCATPTPCSAQTRPWRQMQPSYPWGGLPLESVPTFPSGSPRCTLANNPPRPSVVE